MNKFENYRVEISQNHESMKEATLQKTYFKKWQKYGELVLEDTTGKNLGEYGSSEFRKLNFANASEKPKFPDLTLRISSKDEIDISYFENNVPNWRLFPWAVVAYLEIKNIDKNLDDYIHQSLYYAQCTLLCCPGRNYCLTAIFNSNSIQFCGVRYDNHNHNLIYSVSSTISGSNASVEILKFLNCRKELLGFVDSYPFDDYPPKSVLGRGSTSICLKVIVQGEDKALKISRDQKALTIERRVLTYLNHEGSQVLNTSTLPFPNTVSVTEYMTLISPVYQPAPKELSIYQFVKAWEALHKVHKFGICHRDVRMPNLGVIGNNKSQSFHWIDWSSARPFRDISDFQNIENYQVGSTCTASIPVLNRMLTEKNNYECYPSDEAISIIYLAWIQHQKNNNLKRPHQPSVAIVIWQNQQSMFPEDVKRAVENLEAIGANCDEDALNKIDEIVKSSLEALFPFELSQLKISGDEEKKG